MNGDALEFGIVGIALIVIYKIVDVGKALLLAKKLNGIASVDVKPISTMSPLACQVDPNHFKTILDTKKNTDAIRQYTEANKETMKEVRQGVASGEFGCLWKDRDEVRDFIEGMGSLTQAMYKLTKEVERSNNDR
jgi:hypothetical protein